MALGEGVLSVVTGRFKNGPGIDRTPELRGIQMPGRNPCPPGCTCKKHVPGSQSRLCAADCTCARHRGRPRRTADDRRVQIRDNQRERRKRLPTENAEIVARWREAHPDAVRERNQRDGQKYRDKYLYGLTPEGRAGLLAEQDGCCYLCGELLDTENPRAIHVDHDHSCCRGVRSCGGCIRGLACELCNKGIGAFGDDPERMMRAARNLAAANARVAARLTGPVQAELPIDIKRAARRREESA